MSTSFDSYLSLPDDIKPSLRAIIKSMADWLLSSVDRISVGIKKGANPAEVVGRLKLVYACIGQAREKCEKLLAEVLREDGQGEGLRAGGVRVGLGHWREEWEDLGWILDPRISGLSYQMEFEREKVREVKRRRLGWNEVQTEILKAPQLTQVETSERIVVFEANDYEDFSGPKEVIRGDYVKPISQRTAEIKSSRMRLKDPAYIQQNLQRDTPNIKMHTPQPISPQNEFVSFKPITTQQPQNPSTISAQTFLKPDVKENTHLKPPSNRSSRRGSKSKLQETDYKIEPIIEKPQAESQAEEQKILHDGSVTRAPIDIMAGLKSLVAKRTSPLVFSDISQMV